MKSDPKKKSKTIYLKRPPKPPHPIRTDVDPKPIPISQQTIDEVKKAMDGSSIKHFNFCLEYVKDFNGTQAALRAKLSDKPDIARDMAKEFLQDSCITREVRRMVYERVERSKITADSILAEMYALAKADPDELLDGDGCLRPMKEIPESLRRCISSVEVQELWEGTGKNRVRVGTLKRVRMWDKGRSLEGLAKHLDLIKDMLPPGGSGENAAPVVQFLPVEPEEEGADGH